LAYLLSIHLFIVPLSLRKWCTPKKELCLTISATTTNRLKRSSNHGDICVVHH